MVPFHFRFNGKGLNSPRGPDERGSASLRQAAGNALAIAVQEGLHGADIIVG